MITAVDAHACGEPGRVIVGGDVIMEQVEYPAMSGTNTICVATVLLETGALRVTRPVTEPALDTPAGLVPYGRRSRTAS
jgi:proline racemase